MLGKQTWKWHWIFLISRERQTYVNNCCRAWRALSESLYAQEYRGTEVLCFCPEFYYIEVSFLLLLFFLFFLFSFFTFRGLLLCLRRGRDLVIDYSKYKWFSWNENSIQFLKYMYSLMKIQKQVMKRLLPMWLHSTIDCREVIGWWLSEKSLVSLYT